MHYEIEILHAEPVLTAVVRSAVRPNELSQFVRTSCGEAWTFFRAAGLPKPGRNMALYFDGQGPVEAGAEVAQEFAGNERVICSRLPGGRVAHTVHFGPYGLLGEAHGAIVKWCAAQGHRRAGVCWELYGHWQESWNTDPSNIRTDVFHLLDDKKD